MYWYPKMVRHLITMEGPFIIANKENSSLSFCNINCYGLYLNYTPISGMDKGRKLKQSRITCFFCIGCGKCIFPALDCMVHGKDNCPEFLWFTSLPNFAEFMDTWNELSNNKRITNEEWDFIDQLAHEYPLLIGNDLAEIAFTHLNK